MSVRIELSDGGTPPSAQYPWSVSGTVNVGDVVALDASASKTILRADADNAAARPPIGVCIARNGSLAQVALNGEIATGLSGLTRGTAYWLSTTPGALVSTKPGSSAYAVGVAVSATELLLDGCVADLTGGAGGGVTSAGITSSDFTVSNSPITTSGTVGLALNTVSVAKGGTGLTSASEQGAMPYATSTSAYTMQSVSPTFKNRIINGGMTIAQRGAGPAAGSSFFNLRNIDMFPLFSNQTGLSMSMQQSTDAPSGFTNSFLCTVTTGTASTTDLFSAIFTRIEGTSVFDLAWGTASAKPVTLSFWVKSSLAGTYSIALRNGPSQNRSYIAEYSISTAGWERKTITIPGDTSGTWATDSSTFGIQLDWSLGAGPSRKTTTGSWQAGTYTASTNQVDFTSTTGRTFHLTGVQLEVGSVATNFELRPEQVERALCQRYYQQFNSETLSYAFFGIGTMTTTTNALVYLKYMQTMRGTPTLSTSSPVSTLAFNDAGFVRAVTAVGSANYGNDSIAFNLTSTSLTAGRPALLMGNNTANAFIALSAEL